jgi:hypothetical protein
MTKHSWAPTGAITLPIKVTRFRKEPSGWACARVVIEVDASTAEGHLDLWKSRSFNKAEDLSNTFFFTEQLEGSSQPQATLAPCFTSPLSWQDRDNGQVKEAFKLKPKAGQRPR